MSTSENPAAQPDMRRLLFWALAPLLLLLIPAAAMQVTNEVDWTAGDFIVMGALLGGAGLTFAVLSGMARSGAVRLAIGAAVLAATVAVWAVLATS